jgi:hypothetical protein
MSEEHRRACEARYWIAHLNRDPNRIKALLLRIAAKRGQAAADQLREDMLREWHRPAPSGAVVKSTE